MRIVVHVQLTGDNTYVDHIFHTERAAWNQVADPRNPTVKMDAIDFLALLKANPAMLPGSGWDVKANHPLYQGKTLLEVCLAEITRINDVAARTVLGV